ncbi:MAG: triose-phosphate isomerase [Gammaproteobacteria bacterium]|nr:MAG: triose-phosphate isomerase [Gammaproteobacteria bacterium]
MRRPLIAGNWKMNGTRDSVSALIDGLLVGAVDVARAEMVVCPPAVFIAEAAARLDGGPIALGAQDLSEHAAGAYTGEVAGPMLADYGCRFVIIGHSERRAFHGEDNALVARKMTAAQAVGLTPIACVGETLEERESGATEAVIGRQIDALLDGPGVGALADAVVAYEPVWAIGTGLTATPDQAQAVHAFIRNRISARDATVAAGLRILYGGSVKGANAPELFTMDDIDGGLIGGAALDANEFLTICRAT